LGLIASTVRFLRNDYYYDYDYYYYY